MIKILAGGKKASGAYQELISEYEKRLKKPFDLEWRVMDEDKLTAELTKWPFSGRDFVILCDERGKMLGSPEFAQVLENNFNYSKNIVIIIGGAYGFDEEIRSRADLVWSFSKLVFPHMLFRVMVTEQIYRAQEILGGGKYHHE
jgi:23S rRNA (pseudouridine1915-N3)-methyltransferase